MTDLFSLKRRILLNLKNLRGWKTERKIIIFSVDDYGNVRLDSRKAKEKMEHAGLKTLSRFDAFDAMETKEDLEQLFEALISVKDKNGRHAVFTPFALPCNIDFEKVEEEGFQRYNYELLSETFKKLSGVQPRAYDGAWDLWIEGIRKGIFLPQFHGREHLNVRVFEEKLKRKDPEMFVALANRSYSGISGTDYRTIGYTAAFEFWDFNENVNFIGIIEDGFRAFEKVFGYRPIHFNAPGGYEHECLHKTIYSLGMKGIDTPWIKKEHQGHGRYKFRLYHMGKRNGDGMIFLTRNVLFEPSDQRQFDWSAYALSQIGNAFSQHKPAIISSHRVNFCGHIDPKNRQKGIGVLKKLLSEIVRKWPDVEFMGSHELLNVISSSDI